MPIRFLFMSAACQAIGFAVGIAFWNSGASAGVYLLAHTLVAAGIAIALKLPSAWQVFNFLLPTGIAFFSTTEVPGWLLGGFVGAAFLIYLPTFVFRVPYFATKPAVFDALLAELPNEKSFSFIDLGCGFGSVLFYLAKHRPEAKFIGAELSPLAWLFATFKKYIFGYKNVEFRFADIWKINLNEYDFVYAFLAPPPMPKLYAKAKAEMTPGNTLISCNFEVPDVAAQKVIAAEVHGGPLYVYKI